MRRSLSNLLKKEYCEVLLDLVFDLNSEFFEEKHELTRFFVSSRILLVLPKKLFLLLGENEDGAADMCENFLISSSRVKSLVMLDALLMLLLKLEFSL